MSRLLQIQIVLLLVGALLISAFVSSWGAALSYSSGAGLVLLNTLVLAWGIRRLFEKKLVALSSLIIVIKYAILAAILYKMLKTEWLQPLWFCLGVGTLAPAALGAALFSTETEGESAWHSP